MNNFYFIIEYGRFRRRKDVSQILYQLGIKLTLFYFSIITSFVEVFKYFFDMLLIHEYVVRVNEYIIKINHDINIQKIREYIVYELLKYYSDISKIK